MSAAEPLDVHLYGRHVAQVNDVGTGMATVRYTDEAVASPLGARLSLSLEPQAEAYGPFGAGSYWIRSLLPEGRALDWAVTEFGIARDDLFTFLEVLGRDVAGAVSIYRGSSTNEGGTPAYESLSPDEVAEHVKRAHDVPLALNRKRGVRLSLAGVQDKLLLHHDGDGYCLPINGAPSTLIVKPDPPAGEETSRYSGLSSNELLCLVLARSAGFDAAEARVEDFDGTPALVVVRYDREIGDDGEVMRTHQEDFVSALGRDPLLKYERPQIQKHAPTGGWGTTSFTSRGGPSLRDLADVVSRNIAPARLPELLSRATFNVAVGNADAHARNYSVLLFANGEVQLAPMYDVVCTRAFAELDTDPAQLVNNVDEIDEVTCSDLVAEGCSWGLPKTLALRAVDRAVDGIVKCLASSTDAAIALGASPSVVDEVASNIEKRVSRLASS